MTTPNAPKPPATHHVVQFSGGVGSALSALRVAERFGTKTMTLLIADTKAEDPDLWRFSHDLSDLLGVPLTIVADGRGPWELFRDQRFLGNDRLALCTRHLKQIPCREWMEQHTDPATSVVYVGIEPTKRDRQRAAAITRNWAPWHVEYPLLDGPDRTKSELLDELRSHNLRPPRLYELEFVHNNCGGGCVRAGQRQWKHLRHVFPERYARAEAEEQRMRSYLGKDVSILRQRRNGVSSSLTLAELRERDDASACASCRDLPAESRPGHD